MPECAVPFVAITDGGGAMLSPHTTTEVPGKGLKTEDKTCICGRLWQVLHIFFLQKLFPQKKKGSITNFVGFRISDIIPPAHIEQL